MKGKGSQAISATSEPYPRPMTVVLSGRGDDGEAQRGGGRRHPIVVSADPRQVLAQLGCRRQMNCIENEDFHAWSQSYEIWLNAGG